MRATEYYRINGCLALIRTYRVQHEEVEACAGAEGHQCGAAIQSVACTHYVVSLLEGVFLLGLLTCYLKR